ncbi:MAG: hypothetical protein CM1200mP4_4640 [Rhodospirillaceae bacterium]|nr:MAG: hypothetical protein CM1200mP4_4640 [Rhodospirillaceae bacterium]
MLYTRRDLCTIATGRARLRAVVLCGFINISSLRAVAKTDRSRVNEEGRIFCHILLVAYTGYR